MPELMTSLERVLKALNNEEPDRIPLFLLLSTYGAKELGMSINQYYSKPEYVAEGQIKMREKYHNDCLYTLYYAAIEIEAWGGKIIYCDDGPPNAGEPFIKDFSEIDNLKLPKLNETYCLKKVLETTRILKEKISNEAPIIGGVISPFSIPIMQMGFDKYIELMYEDEKMFNKLMKINEEFCVEWANAQLEAGATAIVYIDPVSSPMIITKEMYKKTGFEIAKRVIDRINGPVVAHFGSSKCMPIIDNIMKTGAIGIAAGALEDIGVIKDRCKGKVSVLGNLNEIEMRRWDKKNVENNVKEIILKAGSGGGLIITNSQSEIPLQVSEEIILYISETVRKWGKYPLDWIDENGQ